MESYGFPRKSSILVGFPCELTVGCAPKKFPAMNQCWNDYYIHFHAALPMESHGIHEVLRLKSYQIQ
jgi:hypothetical protein